MLFNLLFILLITEIFKDHISNKWYWLYAFLGSFIMSLKIILGKFLVMKNINVIYVDGVCNLCNGFVKLVHKNNNNNLFFSTLQKSEYKSII